MNEPSFNRISQTAYYVESCFGDQILSTATAFFVTRAATRYLITNWHVVTGRHPDTHACLSKTGGIPSRLVVRLHRHQAELAFENWAIDLIGAEGQPLWLEHSGFGSKVDVVALPVTIPAHLLAI